MAITAGIDEVGLGALAGPIISCVTVFRPQDLLLLPKGVTDSKKLTELQRRSLYLPICRTALDVGIGHAWPWEIDDLGVSDALQLSYQRALEELRTEPELLYVDGQFPVKGWKGRQKVEPKADLTYREVSAASIVAKVFRDSIMASYHRLHPEYLWSENKGYGSAAHEAAIRMYGVLIDGHDKTRSLHRARYCRKFCA